MRGPKPGSGQTSRTSSGRTLQCGPLRPWLAGPDWMSGLVPAERVRSFLENLIHQFGQNQWLYRFIKNETFCDSLFFQTRGRLQWVLNHRPESEGHPQGSLIILSHVFFLQFYDNKNDLRRKTSHFPQLQRFTTDPYSFMRHQLTCSYFWDMNEILVFVTWSRCLPVTKTLKLMMSDKFGYVSWCRSLTYFRPSWPKLSLVKTYHPKTDI